jgi:lipoprotein-releasing system permease protein
MFGIALGVAALIIVLSVMNGFQKEVRDRMLSVLSHIEVFDAAGSMPDWKNTALQAQKNSSVIASAPYVDGQAMIIRDDVMRGVILRGVLPDQEPKVSEVATKIKVGRWEDLRPGEFNIILGTALASSLHVRVGDKRRRHRRTDDAAGMVPRLKAFNVVGIFDAGHYEFDSGMGFMQIEDAQKFSRLSAPSGLRLRIKDMLKAPQVALELSQT